MTLTREFKEVVKRRAERDPVFRRALLKEALDCLLHGEVEEGKLLMRDYINASIGFEELAELTEKHPKSLMRMFSASGNPRADNLFQVIAELQKREGVAFEVRPAR